MWVTRTKAMLMISINKHKQPIASVITQWWRHMGGGGGGGGKSGAPPLLTIGIIVCVCVWYIKFRKGLPLLVPPTLLHYILEEKERKAWWFVPQSKYSNENCVCVTFELSFTRVIGN